MEVEVPVMPRFPTASGFPLGFTSLDQQEPYFMTMAVCANALVPESSVISGLFPSLAIYNVL